jgi:two-component system nitrate/nitrite response regulator NarL
MLNWFAGNLTLGMAGTMNCLIVDIDSLSIFALGKIVETNFPDWNIFSAKTIQDAIHYTSTTLIDVILLDIELGVESGLTLLAYLQKNTGSNPSQCIVVSNVDAPEKIELCKALGARGYVPKKDACHLIFPVIKQAISNTDKSSEQRNTSTPEALNDSIRLTHRQRDIIDLLLKGYSNKMIAHALNLSYGTVKNYMFDLMRLTAVNSRLEMAMKLQRSGYTPRKLEQINPRLVMESGMLSAADHTHMTAHHNPQSRF